MLPLWSQEDEPLPLSSAAAKRWLRPMISKLDVSCGPIRGMPTSGNPWAATDQEPPQPGMKAACMRWELSANCVVWTPGAESWSGIATS